MQKNIVDNICLIRKRTGLSQGGLAKKIGWNQKQVSRLERGERKELDYENTRLIANALGVDIKEINPDFSKSNDNKNSINKLIKELRYNLPIEIPVYLQRDCGNTDSKIVYHEYSANTNSKHEENIFPTGKEGDFFAMVCEIDYDWPAFSSSELLIADKNLNPTDPFNTPGSFDNDKWELYDRIIIKLNFPIDNLYTHPALWLGQGKALLKTIEN